MIFRRAGIYRQLARFLFVPDGRGRHDCRSKMGEAAAFLWRAAMTRRCSSYIGAPPRPPARTPHGPTLVIRVGAPRDEPQAI